MSRDSFQALSPEAPIRTLQFSLLAVAAVVLRLLCMAWPSNFDVESYHIVADLVLNGENVYATTARYNYGPVWAGIVAAMKWIVGADFFRVTLCLLLSLIDVIIAILLRKRGFSLAAVLFLFSPWSIFISGHHHMFDNLAVLVGLLAVNWAESRHEKMKSDGGSLSTLSLRDTIIAAALLGLSLIIKHILFLFPVWMAFRVRSFPRRAVWLCLPLVLFVASFVPFWAEGADGISKHVLHYASSSNSPIFNMLAPNIIDMVLGCPPHPRLARMVFGGSLILVGMLLRRPNLFEWYLAYLAFVVLLSSATWNQYFVIPVLFTVLYRNWWGLLYNVLAIPFYLLEESGFNYVHSLPPSMFEYGVFAERYGHFVFVALLAGCVIQAYWKEAVARMWQAGWGRIKESIRGIE